jgi:hypothetical protein
LRPSDRNVNLTSRWCTCVRSRLYSWQCTFALLISLLPAGTAAMDLPHYALDSLVYLSTDIVVADITKDTHGNFRATVTEPLFGSLQAGVKLDTLTPSLTFFQPPNDGQKPILFLDRRPRQYDFFHQDAAKSPFAGTHPQKCTSNAKQAVIQRTRAICNCQCFLPDNSGTPAGKAKPPRKASGSTQSQLLGPCFQIPPITSTRQSALKKILIHSGAMSVGCSECGRFSIANFSALPQAF